MHANLEALRHLKSGYQSSDDNLLILYVASFSQARYNFSFPQVFFFHPALVLKKSSLATYRLPIPGASRPLEHVVSIDRTMRVIPGALCLLCLRVILFTLPTDPHLSYQPPNPSLGWALIYLTALMTFDTLALLSFSTLAERAFARLWLKYSLSPLLLVPFQTTASNPLTPPRPPSLIFHEALYLPSMTTRPSSPLSSPSATA